MNGPLVSVLMPAFNAAAFVADAIRSVQAQTHPQWELIIVDDGSRDTTVEVIKPFLNARITLIRQPNSGAASARNAALAAAQGDFIQYLDADDLLHPAKIACQLQAAAGGEAGELYSGRWARFIDDPETSHFAPDALWQDLRPAAWLTIALARNTMMQPAAWLVPHPLSDRAGRWDESLSVNDDGEYFARVIAAATRIRFVDSAISYYRSVLPSSLSARRGEASWLSQERALCSTVSVLNALDSTGESREAQALAFARLAIAAFPAAPAVSERMRSRCTDEAIATTLRQRGRAFRWLQPLLGWRSARRFEDCWMSARSALGLHAPPGHWQLIRQGGP